MQPEVLPVSCEAVSSLFLVSFFLSLSEGGFSLGTSASLVVGLSPLETSFSLTCSFGVSNRS